MRLFATLLLLLSGCIELQNRPDIDAARAYIKNIPAAQRAGGLILVRTSQSQQVAMLAPAGLNADVRTWQSPDRAMLSFRDGVMVATRGLLDDLMVAETRATASALKKGSSTSYTRQFTHLDGENQIVSTQFTCQMTRRGKGSVLVGDRPHTATRHDEICTADTTKITNIFWIGANRSLWKSQQWVSARVGYLTTELIAAPPGTKTP